MIYWSFIFDMVSTGRVDSDFGPFKKEFETRPLKPIQKPQGIKETIFTLELKVVKRKLCIPLRFRLPLRLNIFLQKFR
jgi:hypothetical protein